MLNLNYGSFLLGNNLVGVKVVVGPLVVGKPCSDQSNALIRGKSCLDQSNEPDESDIAKLYLLVQLLQQ